MSIYLHDIVFGAVGSINLLVEISTHVVTLYVSKGLELVAQFLNVIGAAHCVVLVKR